MAELPRSTRVLVVDDEYANYELAIGILEPLGHEIGYAMNGSEALALATADPPDVILLDVMMPDMNGYDVARTLKATPATCGSSIVMMTALDGARERVAAIESGADVFLAKPVDVAELRTRVKSLVMAKAHHDQMRSRQEDLEYLVAAKTRDLESATEKIKASAVETLYRLVAASKYKDNDTGSHIARVSLYAGAIARKLQLDAALVADIEIAAPMHDIGKIGIPDSIILKSTPLSQNEWIIMKQHTVIGSQILKGSDASVIKLAELIALTHHERWDGKGYPHGLRQDEIPLAGRIVAVADVFDALCSKRPYRDAHVYPFEKALAIIQEGRGTLFDPVVVDALMTMQDEIFAIHAKICGKESG